MNEELIKSTARDFRVSRAKLGISQSEMAKRLETSTATLSRIEAEKQLPSLDLLGRYVRVSGEVVFFHPAWDQGTVTQFLMCMKSFMEVRNIGYAEGLKANLRKCAS